MPPLDEKSSKIILLDLVTVSQTVLFFMTLPLLTSNGQVFCKMSFNLVLSDIFLMIKFGLWNLGKKTTEVKCPSHHLYQRAFDNHCDLLLLMFS